MYVNIKSRVVKSYSGGLGQEKIDPEGIVATVGSRYLFVYQFGRVITVSESTLIKTKLFALGHEGFIPFLPKFWAVDTYVYDPPAKQIRVYATIIHAGLGIPIISNIIAPLKIVDLQEGINKAMVAVFGIGTANFAGAYFMSGIKKEAPLTQATSSLFTWAIAIGAAYFLIPPIIRELRKK